MGLTDALAAAINGGPFDEGQDIDDEREWYLSPRRFAQHVLADPAFREALTEDLSEALMWHLDVDPCEHVTWGTNESLNQLAEAYVGCCLLRDD